MRKLSSLNQKIRLFSENLEKAINDVKVQNRNVDLLHENIKVLQNELAQKTEIIKSLMEFQRTVFDSLSAGRNDQTFSNKQHEQQQQEQKSEQLLQRNQQTLYKQHQQQV